MTKQEDVIATTAHVMAPNQPRRIGFETNPDDPGSFVQRRVKNLFELTDQLMERPAGSNGFTSVYSFPDGHSSEGFPPKVDTVFFDFDIPDGHIYNLTEHEDDWKDAINGLLAAVSEVAMHLHTNGMANCWRACLSGHKGVHLYIDFDPLPTDMAGRSQFRAGMNNFVGETISKFNNITPLDIEPYTDADSADLSRLCRMPNTVHPKATERFGETRYCVPVTVDELIGMDAGEYVELTREPRLPEQWNRQDNEMARATVRQHIFEASIHTGPDGEVKDYGGSEFQRGRISRYKEQHAEKFDSVDDMWWKLNGTPCIKEYYERGDQFEHGAASHLFELFVMTHMVKEKAPYNLIVEFFSEMSGFSEAETKGRLNQVIGRSYSPVNCETVWNEAPQFCVKNGCNLYNQAH